ncbi:hypothetical protein K7432_009806 [Basidiobolus ranarum]|uniref:Arrestin C-terminal-like domain-containing protein n=1 Tax=Basidiobolus ranarum TaxID=34480 RepID=A0ABR2VWM2_9FUNG
MIEIRLRDDPVILHGLPEESVGSVLYGTLVITPNKTIKAKAIVLRFQGKMELKNFRETWQQVVFLEHQWTFMSSGNMLHTLHPNESYEFPFEYPIKGSLPVSVNVPNGRISYRLIATIERPPLIRNIRKTELVKVQRAYFDFCGDAATQLSCIGRWANSFRYAATIPKTHYIPGDVIPLHFTFIIHDTHFIITDIVLSIKEVARYSDHLPRPAFETERLCEVNRSVPKFDVGQAEFSMMIEVPELAHPDCQTDVIEVSHLLVAKIKLNDSYKRRWWFYIDTPFVIRSEAQYELSQSPPSYVPMMHINTNNMVLNTVTDDIQNSLPPPYIEKPPSILL